MDLTAFLSALLAIVVIDIVLAGDNAIVIALAARALPTHLRKRAIVWGALGAIAVRSLMTLIVVWLLKIPGLLAFGGALLAWLAYRLLLPEDKGDDEQSSVPTTFWGAMRTIVVADAVMGLDNVLGVAGAAHGHYGLVLSGLLISVPIVMWGSTIVLKVVDRHPSIVYLGAGVLVWTAVKMFTGEPMIEAWLEDNPAVEAAAWLAIPAVLWLGFAKNHQQRESRIRTLLAEWRRRLRLAGGAAPTRRAAHAPGDASFKVLLPVGNSANALRAVRHAMGEYQQHPEHELHLLNVQPTLSRHIARYVSRHDRNAWHRAQAESALAGPMSMLDDANVPYQTHWVVGERAQAICDMAEKLKVHRVVMATAPKHSITRMFEDSVTHRVLEDCSMPVEVIAGEAISRLERWGVPVGVVVVAAALAWLALN